MIAPSVSVKTFINCIVLSNRTYTKKWSSWCLSIRCIKLITLTITFDGFSIVVSFITSACQTAYYIVLKLASTALLRASNNYFVIYIISIYSLNTLILCIISFTKFLCLFSSASILWYILFQTLYEKVINISHLLSKTFIT